MNRNNAIILGLVGLLLGGAIIYAVMRNPSVDTGAPSNTDSSNTSSTGNVDETKTKQPNKPIVVTKSASSVSQSTAVLNGDVNPNGAQTSYRYEYGKTNSLGALTSFQLLGSGYSNYSAPYSISGLSANTTYYYRVVAENQYGRVNGVVKTFTTSNTPLPAFLPSSADTKNATNITTNNATLNGQTNPHGAVTYYWFEYGPTTALGTNTAVNSVGVSNSNISVSANVSILDPNKTYYFRLNTQNGYGVSNGAIHSFTTKPINPLPNPPVVILPGVETMSATNIQRTSATLHGEVDPDGIQTTYHFEYGKSTLLGVINLDNKTPIKSAGGGQSNVSATAVISGLDRDSTYYFQLVAENNNGSIRGAIFSFTTRN